LTKETVAIIALMLASFAFPYVLQGQELLGDRSDGSRATPLHLIPLHAENKDGEKGEQVEPGAELPMPFSTRWTCGECHSYGLVKKGWHFNAVDSNIPPGRPGEPWIYFAPKLCIQIPLSYRQWPGTFRPAQVGLTDFQFTRIFGRHTAGGGPGEVQATEADEIGRQFVSGTLEINCLACHNAHYGQDMGGPGGYAVQVSRQNFRWAAAASCEFASVKGSAAAVPETYDPFLPDPDEKNAPRVTYQKEAFNENNDVLFQIVREVPNQRCYYCHSDLYYSQPEKAEKWAADEDIHLTAGLACVDCHRNGVEHNIVRGYAEESANSSNPLAATSSCEGCHLSQGKDQPQAGRLGAPVPKHTGLPPSHLKKLTCTACHSGPWPGKKTILTKTSRAHRLGTPNVNKAQEVLPHIVAPVFARQGSGIEAAKYLAPQFIAGSVAVPATAKPGEGGKIGPHKVIWPAYWAVLEDDQVKPIAIGVVEKVVGKVFADLELPATGDWPKITKDKITEAIKGLIAASAGKAVYVAGGKLYRLNDSGELAEELDHPAAAPYMWPIAHNVRPAAQSLGARRCEDCHSPDAPFFKGLVCVDSPVQGDGGFFKQMADMYEFGGPVYVRINWVFKLLIIAVMTLLILHILGDLYRRVMLWLAKRAK